MKKFTFGIATITAVSTLGLAGSTFASTPVNQVLDTKSYIQLAQLRTPPTPSQMYPNPAKGQVGVAVPSQPQPPSVITPLKPNLPKSGGDVTKLPK